MRPWQRSQAVGRTHLPSQLFFHLESLLLSQSINIPPIFPGSAQTHSSMKPSWTHLSSCWVPKALFTSLISHERPSYSAPSFVHMYMASLRSWGVRSVHQALCWTLMLIISNPHNKLTGSTGPISQMRKLRLSEVVSLVWGWSAVKQKSWNLNQIMSFWTTS